MPRRLERRDMERFLWICLAGAAGTGARYLIALWAAQRFRSTFPYGTLIVNLVGRIGRNCEWPLSERYESAPSACEPYRELIAAALGRGRTPAVVHFGHAAAVRASRQHVLAAACAAHPERFVKGRPQPADLPTAVWINPPVKKPPPPQNLWVGDQ